MEKKTPRFRVTEADQRTRSVIDHVVDGIITIDAAAVVTTFNPAAERIFGYRAGEVIGRNVRMLMPQPYQGEHDGYVGNYLRTGRARIIGIGREVSGLRKDGSVFPMELAISEFNIGAERFFTGIVRDITERKRAEQELRDAAERIRSVVDHVVDGIITIDEQGRIESLNPAAERIFGYAPAEALGRNVKMLMPEPYHSEHDRYIANYQRTGQARIIGMGREVLGRRKDASTFPMELAVSEFHLGARRYFTGIVRDITERKRLENEAQQRLRELAEADRQKNEFLAMLSHELRNPLAPLRNALYLLKSSPAGEAAAELQAIMERQLQQLLRLVDDLLDVSRIVRGRIDLRREPLDLRDAASRAAETVRPIIDACGHSLEMHLPDRPVWVMGDMVRLAQVLANLLTNAAKYSRSASRIELSLAREGGWAVLALRDHGEGISPELLPRIFELFVQGEHQNLARTQGGLGIGLTLVKRLVEMHDGEVWARSEGAGKGSEFMVRLPALAEAAVATPAEAERAEPPRALGARKRILVIDDNVDAAESVAKILRYCGHEVRCEHDGAQGLARAEAYAPDVVVLDIGLPGMDGYEVARRMRALEPLRGARIVAVTGYGQAEDRRRSAAAGFDEHLTKPVDPDSLLAFVAGC